MADAILPPDPFGWAIPLSEDGQWQPRSLADGTELGTFETKQAAVDAIEAAVGQAD